MSKKFIGSYKKKLTSSKNNHNSPTTTKTKLQKSKYYNQQILQVPIKEIHPCLK